MIPLVITYKHFGPFDPQWDALNFMVHGILMFSVGFYSCTMSVLPPFLPNEYLLETHRDKTKDGQDWEVFAWAIQDVMCKVGKI